MGKIKEINARLTPMAESLVSEWLPGGKQVGSEYSVRNPNRSDKNLGSFKINTRKGVWQDFATGEKGDLIGLYAYLKGMQQIDAAYELEQRYLGNNRPRPLRSPLSHGSAELIPSKPSAQTMRPDVYNQRLGDPTAIYEYCDADGDLCYLSVRYFDQERRTKTFRIFSHGFLNGKEQWHQKLGSALRYPYNLSALLKSNSPVLVTEGEKDAEAARLKFPQYIATTSICGAKSADKTDWSYLRERSVTIWPDNDIPGAEYAKMVATLVFQAGAKEVKIVEVPKDFPESWGLADELPVGYTEEDLGRLVEEAKGLIIPVTTAPKPAEPKVYPADIAEAYIKHLKTSERVQHGAVCSNDHLYQYERDLWRKLSDSQLKLKVTSFIQKRFSLRKHATAKFVNDTILNIKSATNREIAQLPIDLSEDSNRQIALISFQNGILRLDEYLKGQTNLLSHSDRWFVLNKLPFAFSATATPKQFLKLLADILPDPSKQRLLQQWFGYNLVMNTSYHKFLIMIGAGANGKSVICRVLRLLLGTENVSSLDLEAFAADRNFSIAETDKKLANICEDLSEITKVAEGKIKRFVSGDTIDVERKFGHPYMMTPTARLTFATNILPSFRDRSDGIWRRAMLLEFQHQVDPSKQDPRFSTDAYWTESGELPGVFNWAIEGLKDLYANNGFVVPESSKDALLEYKLESNPAMAFLLDNYAYKTERPRAVRLNADLLYSEYTQQIRNNGNMALSKTSFTKEVKKTFPGIELSKHALFRSEIGNRYRVWFGLEKISDLSL